MASRFLIEVPHEASTVACAKAVELVLTTGSHFFNRADWGCRDGDHRAWIIVDVDTRDEARALVPPALRSHAKIIQLNTFSLEEIQNLLRQHQA